MSTSVKDTILTFIAVYHEHQSSILVSWIIIPCTILLESNKKYTSEQIIYLNTQIPCSSIIKSIRTYTQTYNTKK